MASDVDLPTLGAACPQQLTGADLYALCADAWMEALKRRIRRDESSAAAAAAAAAAAVGGIRRDESSAAAVAAAAAGNLLGNGSGSFPPGGANRNESPNAAFALSSHSGIPVDEHEDLYGGSLPDPTAEGALGGGNADHNSSLEEGVDDALLRVSQIDFLTALRNLVPSLSMEELQKYERLRDHYEGRG